jgi:hypothetical protein
MSSKRYLIMKTIYNVAVLMDSQSQCNRMKQLCLDNGLPIWDHGVAFEKIEGEENVFGRGFDHEFYVGIEHEKTLITEAEFIELLKQEKG